MPSRPLSFAAVAVAGALWLGCSGSGSSSNGPPVFNAVDTSLSCPAGQIGWDFSTGGGAGQSLQTPSDGIRIVQATYGANGGVVPGNWTSKYQAVCDDNVTCTRQVYVSATDTDPAYGVAKNFNVQYTCGTEPTVYQTNVPGEAGGTAVTLTCGAPISILHASYGPTGPTLTKPYLDNFTLRAINQCSGLRRCELANADGAAFGSDPAYGQHKTWTFQYYCGQNATQPVTTTFDDGANPLDFQCPAAQEAMTGPTLNVSLATYGQNTGLGKNAIGNWTSKFVTSCNGQESCNRTVFTPGDGDPAFNSAKAFHIEYSCSAAEPVVKMTLPAEAGGVSPGLECDTQMTITKASFGANAKASLAGNFTTAAQAACPQGIRRCRFDDLTNGPITDVALFGSDPAPGSAKTWEFDYTCGSDPNVHSQTFPESGVIDVHCPLAQQQLSAASGIQIDSATYGENCATDGGAVVANNAYANVVQACLGKDVCNSPFNPASDPAPNCAKSLAITYHCGRETTGTTATIPAEAAGKALGLSCAPLINVQNATYGGACNSKLADNYSGLLEEACSGTRGTCSYVLPVASPDPAPNCFKDFSISYTCGDDPTVKTQTIPGESAGKTLTLSCPTPANGYTFEACVPQQCTGLQRRDANLNCVVDNSLLTIPAFQHANPVTITAIDTNSQANLVASNGAITFTQDHAAQVGVELYLASTPAATVTAIAAPNQVTNAVLWAMDTFQLNSSVSPTAALPSTVSGFRCVVLNTGLTWDGTGLSGGSTTINAISPACFGEATVPSWSDAALRLGTDEGTFRSQYTKTGTTLTVSFDDQGQTAALRNNANTVANAFVPNPTGFFYHASSVWEDLISYYQQTQVSSFPVQFLSSLQLSLAATGGHLRSTQIIVPRTPSPPIPLNIDFTWAKYGDYPGVNPFSPTNPPLSTNVQTIAQRNFGATVEIASYADYKAASKSNPQTWVAPAQAMYVDNGLNQGSNQYRDTLLLPGSVIANASGKDSQISVSLQSSVVQRIMTLSGTTVTGGGYGWLGTPDEVTHSFAVRVCVNMDNPTTATATLGSGSSATVFSAQITTPCYVLPEPLVVVRDLEVRPLPFAKTSEYTESANSDDKGDNSQGTQNDVSGMNGCGTPTTVSAPNGTAPNCADHSSLMTNTLATSGSFARQILTSSFSTDANGSTGTIAIEAQAMGYDILDIATSVPASAGEDGFDHTITVAPAYDEIAEALDDGEEADPEPIKPAFTPERVHTGDQGIGIGVEAQGHIVVGAVPLEVTFGAGVGVGISLKFDWDNPIGPQCPATKSDTPNCMVYNANAATQSDASDACRAQGGRLAEAVTSTEWSSIGGALPATAGPTWLGGQAGVNYYTPSCATGTPTPSCATNSVTNYEWMTTLVPGLDLPAAFAQEQGTGTALYLPQNGAKITNPAALKGATNPYFGGPFSALQFGATAAPNFAGLVVSKSNNVMSLAAQSYGANANTPSTAPYMCEFVPTGSLSTTFRSAIEVVLDGAAGISASVCFPDDVAGICLAAELNFIEAELGISFEVDDSIIFSEDNSKVTSQQGETKFDIGWNVDFLAGGVSAELHLVFFTVSWDIFSYDGVAGYEGTLLSMDSPYSVEY